MQWQKSIDVDRQLEHLKDAHRDAFEGNNICHYCRKVIPEENKVFDHNHFTNKYNGPAHKECNLAAKVPSKITLFFHNLSYDMNLVIPRIGTNEVFGPKHHWKVSAIGNIIKCIMSDMIEFQNSYQLLPMSLANLANQLTDADCNLQKEYGFKFATDWGKGLYPYQWFDTVDKFTETIFPRFDDFKNDSGPPVNTVDYANAEIFKKNIAHHLKTTIYTT